MYSISICRNVDWSKNEMKFRATKDEDVDMKASKRWNVAFIFVFDGD